MTAQTYGYTLTITPPHELGINADRRTKNGRVGVGQLWERIAEGKRRD